MTHVTDPASLTRREPAAGTCCVQIGALAEALDSCPATVWRSSSRCQSRATWMQPLSLRLPARTSAPSASPASWSALASCRQPPPPFPSGVTLSPPRLSLAWTLDLCFPLPEGGRSWSLRYIPPDGRPSGQRLGCVTDPSGDVGTINFEPR